MLFIAGTMDISGSNSFVNKEWTIHITTHFCTTNVAVPSQNATFCRVPGIWREVDKYLLSIKQNGRSRTFTLLAVSSAGQNITRVK